MDEKKPLLALNLYLEPQFRKEVIQDLLGNLSGLETDQRAKLIEKFKETVHVGGFRNPLQAPMALQVREAEKVFEKDSYFLAAFLGAWRSLYASEASLLIDTWKKLGFSEADEGADPEKAFTDGWPEGLNYGKLEEKLRQANPNTILSGDQLALLTILSTGQLPGDAAGKE